MTDTNWTPANIPDLTGRIAIVTGANSGIGFETAAALARKGVAVIMACRNLQKAQPAASQIRRSNPPGPLDVIRLDLGDLESVRRFVTIFRERYDRLDLLINNAGIMHPPFEQTTQGFESQFGVNHLGHFALTGQLLDMLMQTPGSRVVTVSSVAHRMGRINFADLNWEKRYLAWLAYGQSKLANLLFAYELQRRLAASGSGILSVAAHPGWTATNLQAQSALSMFFNPIIGQKPPMGALPTLYAATADGVQGGEYFGPDGFFELRGYPKRVTSNARSHDEAVAARLWQVSVDLTGVNYEELP